MFTFLVHSTANLPICTLWNTGWTAKYGIPYLLSFEKETLLSVKLLHKLHFQEQKLLLVMSLCTAKMPKLHLWVFTFNICLTSMIFEHTTEALAGDRLSSLDRTAFIRISTMCSKALTFVLVEAVGGWMASNRVHLSWSLSPEITKGEIPGT